MDTLSEKSRLREAAQETRRRLSMPVLSSTVVERLAGLRWVQRARRILLYHPRPHELDLLGLLSRFPDHAFYLPRVTGEKTMDFHLYRLGDPLQSGRFGIQEPLEGAPVFTPETLDTGNEKDPVVVIVPALMADHRGYRLGYGRGYYDRFLSSFSESAGVVMIAPVPEALLMAALPVDPWDLPVNRVVTEERVLGPFPPCANVP